MIIITIILILVQICYYIPSKISQNLFTKLWLKLSLKLFLIRFNTKLAFNSDENIVYIILIVQSTLLPRCSFLQILICYGLKFNEYTQFEGLILTKQRFIKVTLNVPAILWLKNVTSGKIKVHVSALQVLHLFI